MAASTSNREDEVHQVREQLEPDHKEVVIKYVKLVEPEGTPFDLAYNSQLLMRTMQAMACAQQPPLPSCPPQAESSPQATEGTSAAAEHEEAPTRTKPFTL